MMSLRPPNAASGIPPPMTLPIVVRSGVMPCSDCAPPSATRKTGHHFVVNQHRAVFFGQSAQGFDKGFGRADEVHIADEGFDNHAGDFVAALGKGFFELGDVVVFEYQSMLVKSAGTPAEEGLPKVSRPLPAFTNRLSEWPW